MEPSEIIALTIGLLLIFLPSLIEIVTDYFDARNRKTPVPENVRDVYEPKKFEKYLKFWKYVDLAENIGHIVLGIYWVYIILSKEAAELAEEFEEISHNIYLKNAFVTFRILILDALIEIIPEIIKDLFLERKYLNEKRNVPLYLGKLLAEKIVVIGLEIALLLSVVAIAEANPTYWWAFSLIYIAVVGGVMYGLAPLAKRLVSGRRHSKADDELKAKLSPVAARFAYRLAEVSTYVHSHEHIYITIKKDEMRISISESMVSSLKEEELLAFVGMEIAKRENRAAARSALLDVFSLLFIYALFVLFFYLPGFASAFGSGHGDYAFVFCLIVNFAPKFVKTTIGLVFRQAKRNSITISDRQAARLVDPKAMVSSLKKLAAIDLENVDPSKMRVIMSFDKPSLSRRIDDIEKAISNME